MKHHQDRKELDWVPYEQRPSGGRITYETAGDGRTVMKMEVAGFGCLVVTADAVYSDLLKQFKWDRSATMKARIA